MQQSVVSSVARADGNGCMQRGPNNFRWAIFSLQGPASPVAGVCNAVVTSLGNSGSATTRRQDVLSLVLAPAGPNTVRLTNCSPQGPVTPVAAVCNAGAQAGCPSSSITMGAPPHFGPTRLDRCCRLQYPEFARFPFRRGDARSSERSACELWIQLSEA